MRTALVFPIMRLTINLKLNRFDHKHCHVCSIISNYLVVKFLLLLFVKISIL